MTNEASSSNNQRPSVLMAMSGGVDSSVAAKLLLEQGYDVVGVTMELFDRKESDSTKNRDIDDARSICERLGIPHRVIDLKSTFKEHVMDKFCNELMCGRTPNPCIDCNKHLKFDALNEYREALGLDYMATGHYARRTYDEVLQRYTLSVAANPSKDQTYALYGITQEVLAHTLFPLGELSKSQVREIATSHDFGNADKPDSQDICFIPDGDIEGFIVERNGELLEAGDIVDTAGTIVGRHKGLPLYTLGQRKGLGVAAGEPVYVVGKNVEENSLTVAPLSDALVREVWTSDMNLIHEDALNAPRQVSIKMHYRQKPVAATVEHAGEDGIHVVLHEPQRPSSPGQALVLYSDDTVLGGGTIEKLIHD